MFNKYFFKSLFYFFKNSFKKQKYDVVFYYPAHFNRGEDSKNYFFEPLYEICNKNGITFLVIEEPDLGNNVIRNSDVVHFDFILLLILLLRKITPLKKFETFEHREWHISKILKKTFFRNFEFDNYIVLSNSMVGMFRGLNKDANLYDYQHGLIFSKHLGYISDDGFTTNNMKLNNNNVLVYGKGFEKILKKSVKDKYYDTHSFVLGQNVEANYYYNYENKNIIFSLQFADRNIELNTRMLKFLINFFIKFENFFIDNGVTVLLKHHPRFSYDMNLDELYNFKCVKLYKENLFEGLKNSFLHMTLHSTTTFEASSMGIPTILMKNDILDPYFFIDDYEFPIDIKDDEEIIELISKYLNSEEKYKEDSLNVFSWYRDYYSPIDEKLFIKLIKDKSEKN